MAIQYSTEVKIAKPLNQVLEIFDNADNLSKWQPELISFENISGEPGSVGAQTRMVYKMRNREFEMVETITIKNLPSEYAFTYETKGVKNWMTNSFEATNANETKWIAHNTFKCTGFMAVLALFIKGSFIKETYKTMDRFKAFAESK